MGRGRQYSTEQVLQVLRDRDRENDPVLTTVEIAERLGTTRQTVGKRLDELKEEEQVVSSSYGQMSVWWPADEIMRDRPDEDAVEVDRRAVENNSRILSALKWANGASLFVWVVSSLFLTVFAASATSLIPKVPTAVGAIGLLGTPVGTVCTLLFTGAYNWLQSDLHATIIESITDTADVENESDTADTQETTTA